MSGLSIEMRSIDLSRPDLLLYMDWIILNEY